MRQELVFYSFSGAPDFQAEMWARFSFDDDMRAGAGGSRLIFGKLDGLKDAVWIEGYDGSDAAIVILEAVQ